MTLLVGVQNIYASKHRRKTTPCVNNTEDKTNTKTLTPSPPQVKTVFSLYPSIISISNYTADGK